MPKIIWKGIIKSEAEFPCASIPPNAKRLEAEEDMAKMQIKALPYMIPSVLLCFFCMFAKTFAARQPVIHIGFLFIGVVLGFFLILVHELLHAVAYPKGATVYIGIMPKNLTAVALSARAVKRSRFFLISLLPIVLGLIPLGIFCLTGSDAKEWNGLLFGMAIMGMVSVYPDIYNIAAVLKAVPKGATIQNNGNETYYYE